MCEKWFFTPLTGINEVSTTISTELVANRQVTTDSLNYTKVIALFLYI